MADTIYVVRVGDEFYGTFRSERAAKEWVLARDAKLPGDAAVVPVLPLRWYD